MEATAISELRQAHQRLQRLLRQDRQDLELARQVQSAFLPRELPQAEGLRLAVHHRPCGRAGGDCFDFFPLDGDQVGFFLADVLGHGTGAALLAIYLHQFVRSAPQQLRQPQKLLQHLNRALLDLGLAEPLFITMLCGCLDASGAVTFSRAGHPPPLYLPAQAEPLWWDAPGSLLGVFDSDFTRQLHRLESGDRLLLASDGIDAAWLEGSRAGPDLLIALAQQHRSLPLQQWLEQIARDLQAQSSPQDDFTLLAVEKSTGE